MFTQNSFEIFWQTIAVMIKGMGGIFLFMFIFFWIVKGLDKLFPKEIEKHNNQAE
jgi:Na+-transporting methylmalonyl-CoA/oxaloacetate decarboxylase gamma subunit